MKTKIQFKEASCNEIIGTASYRGYILASAKEISKVLGEPMQGDDKSVYEWYRKYGSVVFTIYDYKESVRPRKDKVIEYHIGTKSEEDTYIVIELLIKAGLTAYILKF